MPISHKLFQKIEKEETSQLTLEVPNHTHTHTHTHSLTYTDTHTHTLTYTDTHIHTQRQSPVALINTDIKILNKILAI
jgi:hypothetical protein